MTKGGDSFLLMEQTRRVIRSGNLRFLKPVQEASAPGGGDQVNELIPLTPEGDSEDSGGSLGF